MTCRRVLSAVVWAAVLAAVAFALSRFAAKGAPAPLPRQDRRPAAPLVPGECLLIWHTGKYHASFRPDGDYGAVPLSGGVEWRGTWRRDGAAVLVTEYATGWAPTQTITWRASVGGDDPVRLEPWGGRPKVD